MSDSGNQDYISIGFNDQLQRVDSMAFPLSSDTNQTSPLNMGSVEDAAVKSDGAMTDVWIKNSIRSTNWAPKTVGFYIDGQTGYAEFANVYVSGTIVSTSGTIGGFVIGADYIRDSANSMGLASTVTGGDDVRFWAGATFANRATAPFIVTESGVLAATNATITGTITGSTIIGGTLETSSGAGQRIVIESVNNTISFYNSSNVVVAQMGGGTFISSALRITSDTDTTDGVFVTSSIAGSGFRYVNDSNVLNNAMVISQQGTTNNTNPAIQITRKGSGEGIFINHSGASGRGLLISSAAGTSFPIEILNAGTSTSIDIEDTGGATSIGINNSTSSISNFGIDMVVTSNSGAPVGIRFNITRSAGGNSYAFQFAGPEFASSGFAGSIFRKVRVLFPSGNVGYLYAYDG